MTAHMINHWTRKPLVPLMYIGRGWCGDEELECRPFVPQLWERIAEGVRR
jgi:hypothetical protein